VRGALRRRPAEDVIVIERVRAQLGRVVSHPHTIEVKAARGLVTVNVAVLQAPRWISCCTGSNESRGWVRSSAHSMGTSSPRMCQPCRVAARSVHHGGQSLSCRAPRGQDRSPVGGARLTLLRGLRVHVAVRPIHARTATRGTLRCRGRLGHRADNLERLLTVAAHELVHRHSTPLSVDITPPLVGAKLIFRSTHHPTAGASSIARWRPTRRAAEGARCRSRSSPTTPSRPSRSKDGSSHSRPHLL
jgi:hypothetical protein